jgi:Uma2 family endonuclease
MDVAVSRRRFTVDDYHRMGEVGILSPTDRVELIDGEIVSMTPTGPRHGASVDRTNRVLVTAVGTSAIVRVQGSVRLDLFHEPEPDIVLLRPRADFYASAHPGPADILLVIEFAESSIDYDRDIKKRVYAKAGVVEILARGPERGHRPRPRRSVERRLPNGDQLQAGTVPRAAVASVMRDTHARLLGE